MSDDPMQKVLEDNLRCNTNCAGNFVPEHKCLNEERFITWLVYNLPALPNVTSRLVDYIFSNGMRSDSDEESERLKNWLYSYNIEGNTNYSVLQEGILQSSRYGRCGIRWLSEEDGIINVYSRRYMAVRKENKKYKGFFNTEFYITTIDPLDNLDRVLDLDSKFTIDREYFRTYGYAIDKNKKLIILSKDELLDLRWNPADPYGKSPFLYDMQRTKLLSNVYQRLNYDIEYDGAGRIIFKLSSETFTNNGNDVSTDKIVGNNENDIATRVERAKTEATQFAKEVKEAGSDAVLVATDSFEDFKHLPRVTKSTEFFDYISNEGEIICQILGVSPALFEFGKIYGNVSMKTVIDNAILNCIIPIREKFATQISGFLSEKLGVSKIYFDMYKLQQTIDENDARETIVDIITKLRDVGSDDLAEKFENILNDEITFDGELKTLQAEAMQTLTEVLADIKLNELERKTQELDAKIKETEERSKSPPGRFDKIMSYLKGGKRNEHGKYAA